MEDEAWIASLRASLEALRDALVGVEGSTKVNMAVRMMDDAVIEGLSVCARFGAGKSIDLKSALLNVDATITQATIGADAFMVVQ